jgi:quercetin dioxygenase-like cupin family protein
MIMRKTMSWMTAAAILSGGVAIGAREAQHGGTAQQVSEAQWGPAPPMVPPGAQIAVLAGDPGKAAPYTVRLKFPANYAIPAHSHPTDENVAVVSGSFTLGMGDKLVKGAASNKTLTAGGYALAPAGMNHFAYTGAQEVTILLYGVGPVEFKYVNPSDDPRNRKTTTAAR